ncbi:uncharacterized protein LOC121424331 isoform X2 [Lytechinus variegatus]|uniref:uncharacterized protein LOC121424331 isoform X2 n=1 Tax=Lytechinus variegatus TaxID=7654 RepID=UPI001BB28D0D|nr:uncharacterized protein LOC121424331 isoform X2 [Lytechinus variegatus]
MHIRHVRQLHETAPYGRIVSLSTYIMFVVVLTVPKSQTKWILPPEHSCQSITSPDGTEIQLLPKLIAEPPVPYPGMNDRDRHLICRLPAFGAKMFMTPYTGVNGESPGLFVADLQEGLRFSSIPATREPSNIAYDSQQKKIYWTDNDVHKVFRADASGGTQREEVSYENNDRSHLSIAESLSLLFIAYLKGKKVTTTDIKPGNTFPQTERDFKTGLEGGLSSMAVDEGEGFLYLAVGTKIQRTFLNGSGKLENVFRFAGFKYISGLSIDIRRSPRRLFVCDFFISRTFYKDVMTPLSEHEASAVELNFFTTQSNIRHVAQFNNSLYWTNIRLAGEMAVMSDYDKSSRSFSYKTIYPTITPQNMIIVINP